MNSVIKGIERFIPIHRIVIDPTIQVRVEVRTDIVQEYSERLQEGDIFPAIIVFVALMDSVTGLGDDDGPVLLADGFHRLLAFRDAGRREIKCDVRVGDRSDALKCALRSNMAHGIQMTNADKWNCVKIALASFAGESDRSIASMCGVSHPFVGKVRAKLVSPQPHPPETTSSESPDQGSFPPPGNDYQFGIGQDGIREGPVPESPVPLDLEGEESPHLKLLLAGWEVANRKERRRFLKWAARTCNNRAAAGNHRTVRPQPEEKPG